MIVSVVPLRRTPLKLPWLDYAVPENLAAEIAVGQLVKIPLRNKEIFGIVKEISAAAIKINFMPSANGQGRSHGADLKPVNSIVIHQPLLAQPQLAFLEEMARLYHTSLGFLLKFNLPPLQKRKLAAIAKESLQVKYSHPAPAVVAKKLNPPLVSIYQSKEERRQFLSSKLNSDKNLLVLLPEWRQVRELTASLPPDIREKCLVVTGELTNKALFDQWFSCWRREKNIIIGTRRALFLPVAELDAIILDDEGNPNYKSWDMAPRFHTRDAALLLAKHTQAQVELLAHTPSVETYYFAEKKVYRTQLNQNLATKARSTAASPTFSPTSIINMADERRGGSFSFLSEQAEQALEKSGGDVFLFINRLGNWGYVSCRDCQTVSRCPTCQRALVFHEDRHELRCHFCRFRQTLGETCPACGGARLATFGIGTKTVEKEIRARFGNRGDRIIRIDDETKDIKTLFDAPAASDATNRDQRRIIIGTQLAWEYLDWEKISLMIGVDADTSLFIPEYKTTEKLWQLLRSVRFNLPPETPFFIQTNHPDNPVFRSLDRPEQFYKEELEARRRFGYPPFYFLAKLFFGNSEKALVIRETDRLAEALSRLTKDRPDITITPPLDMFPAWSRGRYWRVLLIKLPYANYKQLLREILPLLGEQWKVDLNPNGVFTA